VYVDYIEFEKRVNNLLLNILKNLCVNYISCFISKEKWEEMGENRRLLGLDGKEKGRKTVWKERKRD